MEIEEFTQSELPEETECITIQTSKKYSNNNLKKKKREREYTTQEFCQTTKRRISKDRSKTLTSNIQNTKSSKTSDLDSTTNDVASKPFWNEFTKELSKKLWLPTEIDCVDMDSNLLNSSSRRLIQNSWFSVRIQNSRIPRENLQTIFSQSVTTSLPKRMECEQPKTEEKENKKKPNKPQAGKTRKVRLYPNTKQRETLMKWFRTTRWTYNQCLAAVEKEKVLRDKKALRAKYINSELFKKDNKWILETPYDVRDEGMNDLLKAYKTNFSKKNKKKFKIKYRSKKCESESIVIHSKHWKKAGVFHPKSFGTEPIRASEPLPDKLYYDCRLQRNRLGEFYLCIPMPLEVRSENQAPQWKGNEGIISIDPGIRTFATCYSPSGMSAEWGRNDIARIYRLCYALDKLQSKWSQKDIKHQKRYRLKRAARRIRKKIRNLVDEVHKKLSKWIVENHHTVLLPKFETQKMVGRSQRKIGSKTARAMLGWSHYRFQQRLLNKTREYPWCKVTICDEHFTSKTCGNCGNLENIGLKKTFRCGKCETELDRDLNGARNILLRYFTLSRVSPDVGAYPLGLL